MTTTFLLVRHALHELGGETIAGRMPGVRLSPAGRVEADGLVARLAGVHIDAVCSSPLERTMATAEVVAGVRGLVIEQRDGLLEIDYGDWTGCRLDDLRGKDEWEQWNTFRSCHRAPGGESMLEIQQRVVAELMALRHEHPEQTVLAVSHGDVIKAALAHFLGTPLDLFQRIEISTASISVVVVGDLGPWVQCVNQRSQIAELPLPRAAASSRSTT